MLCGHLTGSPRIVNTVSVGEAVAALLTSSLQHFSAVGSSHSLPEAVLLLSLALLGLVGSDHGEYLAFLDFRANTCSSAGKTPAANCDKMYYNKKDAFCQAPFLKFYPQFPAVNVNKL